MAYLATPNGRAGGTQKILSSTFGQQKPETVAESSWSRRRGSNGTSRSRPKGAASSTSSQVLPWSCCGCGSFSACSQRCGRAAKRKDIDNDDDGDGDLAAGKLPLLLLQSSSSSMLITFIYCAHNMGAHPCYILAAVSVLFSTAPTATCDACIAGHATAGSARVFPLFLHVFLFSFTFSIFFCSFCFSIPAQKFNYRECEFLPDSESDSASHVLFQASPDSANFQRISILFAVDLCNAPAPTSATPSSTLPGVPSSAHCAHSNNRCRQRC